MDSSEIKNLVDEYLEKGQSLNQIKTNLKDSGYDDEDIDSVISELKLPVEPKPAIAPKAEKDLDWSAVGDSILDQQKKDRRNLAWGPIIFFGGFIGYRLYFTFWFSLEGSIKQCQGKVQTDICYQNRFDTNKTIIACVAGAIIAVIIAKICYLIADRLRARKV